MSALGPVHPGYDPLDLVHEARRRLDFRFDGPILAREKRAAEAALLGRRALLAKPRGLFRALRADIAAIEALRALHRRQLRLDVRAFRRRRGLGLDTGYERIAIEHEKAMLRLLGRKLDEARALLGAARPSPP